MCVVCSWLRNSAARSVEKSALVQLFFIRDPISGSGGSSEASGVFNFLATGANLVALVALLPLALLLYWGQSLGHLP